MKHGRTIQELAIELDRSTEIEATGCKIITIAPALRSRINAEARKV